MTTLDDDESLERELFTRRERALAAAVPARVPSLEDVLRAAGAQAPPRSNVVSSAGARRPARRTMSAVLLLSACAAAIGAAGPQLRRLVVGAPEATIVAEPAPRADPLSSRAFSPEPASAPSASMMPATSRASSPVASPVAASVDSDVCGGDPGDRSDTCSMSCEAESRP